jgi:hypothetical protein
MDMFTVFIFLAVAAVIISLGSGILSMVVDLEIAHMDSAHWMSWRVGLQALAVVLVLLAMQKGG